MEPDEYALWQFKVDLVKKQLARIEHGVKAILAEMNCPADPVQICAILEGKQEAPWPKRGAEGSKRHAKYAMHVLLHIGKLGPMLGPGQPDAPMAADAALTVGWLASQLGLELTTKARAKKAGHTPKRKAKRSAARRHAILRKKAATLPPKLSAKRKAELLARTSKLSAETIRHIIE